MSIIPFKSMMRYLLLSFLLILSACNDTVKGGGGVIVVTEDSQPTTPSEPPPYTGPFGGPILNDDAVPLPSPYLPPYTFYEIQEMIDRANPGDTVVIDRDVNAIFGISISKSIKLTSPPDKIINFVGRNISSSLFTTLGNNVELSRIKFDLQNVAAFYTGNIVTGEFSGLILKESIIELSGISVLKINLDGVNLKNNTIVGLSNGVNESRALVELSGNNAQIIGNTIVDLKDSYGLGLSLRVVDTAEVRGNVIKCNCKMLGMPIRAFSLEHAIVSENILEDTNSGRLGNNGYYPDEDFDGSFGIGLELSHYVSDGGISNKFFADRYAIDDRNSPVTGHSDNINLLAGIPIPMFTNEQLFNYIPTKDWTPICNIGNNPSISTTAKTGWLSYTRANSQVLYYTGAIQPGCL